MQILDIGMKISLHKERITIRGACHHYKNLPKKIKYFSTIVYQVTFSFVSGLSSPPVVVLHVHPSFNIPTLPPLFPPRGLFEIRWKYAAQDKKDWLYRFLATAIVPHPGRFLARD
ncbi:hypothetical protein TNCV_1785681 [Trichonephila clavipes]|nr:hypothetical protein TNCV_1785681 [Trichonephila clavipes]